MQYFDENTNFIITLQNSIMSIVAHLKNFYDLHSSKSFRNSIFLHYIDSKNIRKKCIKSSRRSTPMYLTMLLALIHFAIGLLLLGTVKTTFFVYFKSSEMFYSIYYYPIKLFPTCIL